MGHKSVFMWIAYSKQASYSRVLNMALILLVLPLRGHLWHQVMNSALTFFLDKETGAARWEMLLEPYLWNCKPSDMVAFT